MRQYPIWNQIQACVYKGAKSYGVRKEGVVKVLVGTSSVNSHHFLTHVTTHRLHDDGSREYRFYIDGEVIKTGILPKGADSLEIQN